MNMQTQQPSSGDAQSNQAAAWTSGEWVGEGQGVGPRYDTGTFHTRQWIGEGQGAGPPGAGEGPWTSGEWVGEGQGVGPRHDTGTFNARQWIGEPPTRPSEH